MTNFQNTVINIAVVGEVDAAKSTLVGVLSTGKLDDGKGSSRLSVFTCKHEIECGRTSDISTKMVNINKNLNNDEKR